MPAQESSATWSYSRGQLSLQAHGHIRERGRDPYYEALRMAEKQLLVPTRGELHPTEPHMRELTRSLLTKAGVLVGDFLQNPAGVYYQTTGDKVEDFYPELDLGASGIDALKLREVSGYEFPDLAPQTKLVFVAQKLPLVVPTNTGVCSPILATIEQITNPGFVLATAERNAGLLIKLLSARLQTSEYGIEDRPNSYVSIRTAVTASLIENAERVTIPLESA